MPEFLKRQISALAQWVRSQPRLVAWAERILPRAEKVVIAGPTLVGFTLGLLRHQPGSVHFETGFQSLAFFLAYLAVLTVLQILDSLFFSSWPIVLGVARSLAAAFYLAITLRQVLQWRAGSPQILPVVARLRERLRPVTGDAA